MGLRPPSVVPVGRPAELDFENLARRLQQLDGVVDGGETCAGKSTPDLFVYLANRGMDLRGQQHFEKLGTTGCDDRSPCPKDGLNLQQPGLELVCGEGPSGSSQVSSDGCGNSNELEQF